VSIPFEQVTALIGSFLWPLVRIAAMLMAAPIFGARNIVFVAHRVGFAVALTIIVYPYLPAPPAVNPLSIDGLFIVLHQFLIGMTMGLILQFVFGSLVIAGHNISMTMGLGFASFIDPSSGLSVPVISKLYLVIGTLLFFSFDGHLLVIQTLLTSFESMPIGTQGIAVENYMAIVLWGSKMYIGALLIALPCMITLTLINVGFGVMTRAAPQMNIFAVGFPTTLSTGIIIIMTTMPNVLPRFHSLLMESIDLIQSILQRS